MLGAIVVAFVLAFFSLAQTMRVSATGYDLERLNTERDALLVRKQELLTDLNRLTQDPADPQARDRRGPDPAVGARRRRRPLTDRRIADGPD